MGEAGRSHQPLNPDTQNLQLLSATGVRNIFCSYLGHQEYRALYEMLESYVSENRETDKSSTLNHVRLDEISTKFSGLAKRHERLRNKIFQYSLEHLTEAEALDGMVALDDELEQEQEQLHQDIRLAVNKSIRDVAGWQSYLKLPFVDSPIHTFIPNHLYLLAPLMELISGEVSSIHIKTLNDYIRTDRLIRGTVNYINTNVINVFELFHLVPWDKLSSEQVENMDELLEILDRVQNDVEEEIEYDNYG